MPSNCQLSRRLVGADLNFLDGFRDGFQDDSSGSALDDHFRAAIATGKTFHVVVDIEFRPAVATASIWSRRIWVSSVAALLQSVEVADLLEHAGDLGFGADVRLDGEGVIADLGGVFGGGLGIGPVVDPHSVATARRAVAAPMPRLPPVISRAGIRVGERGQTALSTVEVV